MTPAPTLTPEALAELKRRTAKLDAACRAGLRALSAAEARVAELEAALREIIAKDQQRSSNSWMVDFVYFDGEAAAIARAVLSSAPPAEPEQRETER